MSLSYHRRLRFMQPVYIRAWLAVKEWALNIVRRLADGIGEKP